MMRGTNLKVPTRIVLACCGALGTASLVLTGCGSEEQADTASPAATSVSESTSPAVVGGPRPASPTTSIPDETAAGTKVCDKISGPDGALRVQILAGDLSCSEAMTLAKSYGPKIASGEPQDVDGWTCAPATGNGLLAACEKGSDRVGFAP
ncbi:hypothetical protein [Gordonia otitidis]|uniref:Secreted protein n=1 Tax=Gordonia otitidis (strain DSM 44809 / CCUG 52243 / JCM 12355 / NBRC 100426 / IFM 10032) TaxID=1108044 RepID=H5TMW8_GORO1|nr:hypothetical protein [Gordonia otitidis]UEA60623.1 hypothetical protein LK459_07230 [Gordonia otitidis]GAB34828.1 hypothetical protein GOOTI_124_00030 [Gordonia otitidis NBRC 100426]